MFVNGFRDLVKPQWVNLIEELKRAGGLSVPELQRRLGGSYMGLKDQCEALRKRGYVEKWRRPRKDVGRPEITYRLTPKSDGLLPDVGVRTLLDVLEGARQMFGDTAPERLLLLYFQTLRDRWRPRLAKAKSLVEKATLLASLRQEIGCFCRCHYDPDDGFRIEEFHHPLRELYAEFPNARQFELRSMEELLGTRIVRREIPGGPAGPARIDYEIATLGVNSKPGEDEL